MTIVHQLVDLLGSDGVLDGAAAAERPRNHWDTAALQAKALVRPRSSEEVSQVLRLCNARGQPVVTHGGRTGVCDGDRSTSETVVISLERMKSIEDIDTVGRTVTVQAGCTLEALHEAVESKGLYFPLDLGARGSCTIGGNAATNAGGTTVIRYGMMRALVLGLEAVLPDGTIISSMNRMLKNNSGYDLKQLFIGSEGTLGIVTRLVLTLKELPSTRHAALLRVDDGEHLATLLKHMDRALGGTLSSFEAMWGDYYRAVTEEGWHTSPLPRDGAFYVIVEALGTSAEDGESFTAAVESVYEAKLITDAVLPKSEAERERIWAIREDFEALRVNKPLFLYDISLPIRDMIEYVDDLKASLKALWPAVQFYVLGHIGDGNLHFFITPGEPGDTAAQHAACDERVYRPLAKYHGAISAEHGIGLEKKTWLPVSRSPEEIDLMRLLKRTLDPKNILNPGKVLNL